MRFESIVVQAIMREKHLKYFVSSFSRSCRNETNVNRRLRKGVQIILVGKLAISSYFCCLIDC
jgi:hypothetical protein